MQNCCSITEARRNFAAVIQQVETGEPIYITRRGKIVAVLLSQAEYERLVAQQAAQEPPPTKQIDFVEAYQAFRASLEFADVEIDPEIFNVRDKSPGRDVSFE